MHDFDKVYNMYFKDVYRYTLVLCNNAHLAEEITQETFFRALKKINGFREESELRVWICQIARNLLADYYRKNKRIAEGDIPEEADKTDIEKSLTDKENAMCVHKALHKIAEPYKEVFSLRIFGELSFQEICKLFGRTESWARVTFYRAKQKIIKEMEEEDEKLSL